MLWLMVGQHGKAPVAVGSRTNQRSFPRLQARSVDDLEDSTNGKIIVLAGLRVVRAFRQHRSRSRRRIQIAADLRLRLLRGMLESLGDQLAGRSDRMVARTLFADGRIVSAACDGQRQSQ